MDERLRHPPPPWTFHVNEEIGAFYYYNNDSGVSQWEYPGELEPVSSAAPSSSSSSLSFPSAKARKGLVDDDNSKSFTMKKGDNNNSHIMSSISSDLPNAYHNKAGVVYKKGDVMMYVDGNLCEIIGVHFDDDPPYYTVRFGRGGRERQTQAEKIRPALSQEMVGWQSDIMTNNEPAAATGISIPVPAVSVVDTVASLSVASLSPRLKPTPYSPLREEKDEKNKGYASAIKEKPASLTVISQEASRLKNGWSTEDIHNKSEGNEEGSFKKKEYIIGPGGQSQDYLNLARIHKMQVPFYSSNIQSRPLCVLCNKEGPLDVLFPCEHRAVCRTCIKKEGVVPIHDMNKVPNGHCNCPLCNSIIKLILPWERGDEVEKYWQWIEEVKPELPGNFMKNWRHSAAIIEKCWIQDNDYNGSVVVNTGTGSCCTIS